MRDYIHVSDLAEGHVRALDLIEDGAGQHIYNLGTGRGVSVFELIEAARAVTGSPIPFVVGPRRPGDPARLFADTGRARQDFGWAPRYSDLAEILSTAWAWTKGRQD